MSRNLAHVYFCSPSVCFDPSYLIAVDIPSRWSQSTLTEMKRPYSMRHVTLIDDEKTRKFMEDIGDPVARGDGDSIPISKVSIVQCSIIASAHRSIVSRCHYLNSFLRTKWSAAL